MKAVRLHQESRVRVEEIPDPAPGAGEVRVAVKAAGVCGTDLHAAHGRLPVPVLPVTMGHEGAGVVDAVGEGVAGIEVEDRVLLLPSETCGSCPPCRAGHLGLCPQARIFGMGRDGTFAERIVVPASCVLHLPQKVPFEHGAILADAVATAYHAVAERCGGPRRRARMPLWTHAPRARARRSAGPPEEKDPSSSSSTREGGRPSSWRWPASLAGAVWSWEAWGWRPLSFRR
jgi:D-arabinose 1-dehydrogenase-like Zn-dependent alcohol dehydrogenase